MEFTTTPIPGLIHFRPAPHRDQRGFFSRTFDAEVAREAGIDPSSFMQDSMSRSGLGVIRALHIRLGQGEGKLVRCSQGALFDVVVDLRPSSPAYRSWLSFDLDGESQTSIYIPPGCAHGFQALSSPTDTSYRIDRAHDPSEALTIAWNDPELAIPWPLNATAMSESDLNARPLAELGEQLGQVAVTV